MTTNKDVENQAKECPDAKDDVYKDVANKKGGSKKEGRGFSGHCFCLIGIN